MRTIVYADGGCDPNPGPGGWGVVIQMPDAPVELHGGELVTTNNRMELTAAISALEYFPEGTAIEMRCDSQYVVKSVTEWIPGWKRRGWRTASGPVKNVDLMERLDTLAQGRDVRWTWVRGHSGEVGNERADRLAAIGRRVALGLPAVEEEAPAGKRPAAPAGPATVSMTVDAELAAWVAQAAERAGLSRDAFVAEALRLALELGPERVARIRKEVALESAAPRPGELF
ncbi:ribonuclease HI [Methylobacterium sp. C25]|uniref:ribonuclease HI n=1 Tax=Methylobacterium sp. C25 TaxID=2721622 RepID=UPI001F42C060|nr:ribonuclease HI [Methylobacterium sp. C25]MCE4224160.1 ribonuclease HI [Methylobacterium sp. C25]